MKPSKQECQSRLTRKIFYTLFIYVYLLGYNAFGDILKAHEPKYALAVLAYNDKKYAESLKILNELLKESPGLVEFLELKALALKSSKDDVESAKTYQALIDAKTAANAPKKEIAPYEFELGVNYFRAKDWNKAEPHLLSALDQEFNPSATEFFLGMIYFQTGRYANAIQHFKVAAKSNIEDLSAPAAFYLGQSYLKNGEGAAATGAFITAKLLSKDLVEKSPTAKNIFEACEQILSPLDHSQKFGTVSLGLGYDSNVQALPDQSEGTLNINKSTLKTLLQAGIGIMSSPTETFQWVPSYRLSYNKNFNSDTREGEFFTQDASVYLNHRPLDPSSFGFKLDLSHTFQNQFDTTSTSSSTFRQFSLSGDLDAYYRTSITKDISGYFEVGAGPQKYFADSSLTTHEKRSGLASHIRTTISHSSITRFFTPSISVMLSGIDSGGSDFSSGSHALSLQDSLNFSDETKGYASFSISQTQYPNRQSGSREDQDYTLALQIQHQLNPKWSLGSDASISRNTSNVSEYQYSRWTLSTGVTYSFY